MQSSSGIFLSEKHPFFPDQEPRKICEKQEDFYENRSYEKTEGNEGLIKSSIITATGLVVYGKQTASPFIFIIH